MKNPFWLAVIALLFLHATPSTAQCGLYAYQDLWLDGNGNAVGDNYTQAIYCEGSWAYAEVHVAMPSGYQNGASASGGTTAEAVTQTSTSAELGDGVFSGSNVASSYCWDTSNESSFGSGFSVGESFTWYQYAFGTTFNQMQPCPEPGFTITCTASNVVFSDPNDVKGVYFELGKIWLKLFGHALCSPFSTKFWQNAAPERPYCFDLP